MERLTKRLSNGTAIYNTPSRETVEWENNRHRVLQKLADYEDLEEQGLLLKLPCKVGDTIYYPWIYGGQSGVALNEVESINIYYNRLPIITAKDWESDMCMDKTFTIEDFGKTVFLTLVEAEQALKRLESESDAG